MGKKEKKDKEDKSKKKDKEDKPKKEKKDKDDKSKGKDKKEHKEDKPKKESTSVSITSSEVIFFPDEKMPCNNGSSCKRKQCNFAHEPTGLTRMLDVLSSAKKTLDICVFTITANEIADRVIDIHKSGVTVRVITDDDQRVSSGSDIQRMADAGIQVKDDASKFHMHHKFAIVDKKVLVNGSFNWTRQAVLSNRENVVITPDKALVTAFGNEFETMWDMY
mmetsp:Transcript_128098/g.190885  ORF Transcript_128098/g.190885 Transcript_128098/m.190885 type:complete len:220 (-) Transcript_128098:29-688(-)